MKSKKSFYRNWINNNYFRDLRVIADNGKTHLYQLISNEAKYKNSFLNNILKKDKGRSTIATEIYPCVDMGYYYNKKSKNKKKVKKVYDKLFFDFDIEDNKAKEIKKKIQSLRRVEGSIDIKQIKELQLDFQELLINNEIAKQPINEAKELHNYLKNHNIKSYLIFSGSKGSHLYTYFPPSDFQNINELSLSYAKNFKKTLNLNTLDLSVNRDAYSRISRLPYTLHDKTLLNSVPYYAHEDYETIFERALKLEILDFNIKDYQNSKNITHLLKKIDNQINQQNIILDKEKKYLSKLSSNNRYINGEYQLNDLFKDCRKLAKKLLGKPEREYKDYITYKCPFHDDNVPSLSVYKKVFFCGVCGKFNYFEFTKKYCNFTNDEMKNFMSKTFKRIKQKC